MTIHLKIAEILIQQLTETNNPLKSMLDGRTPDEICRLVFISYRGGGDREAKGLKLSEEGLQLMKACFKHYDVKLPDGYHLRLPHLLYLDRVSKLPYFVNSQFLTTFDSELTMMLKLCDGNLSTLVENRYRLSADKTSLVGDL